MTTARFTVVDGPAFEVAWHSSVAELRSLDDLRRLLLRYKELDAHTLERLGVVACLFVADQLWASGGNLGWNDLQRALDPYYLVVQEPEANDALQRGIEAGIDRIRELRETGHEAEYAPALAAMLA